jgi:4a-hydroxytetrahydrobiopterin dehydratase
MSETLAGKTRTPCRGGVPPLKRDEAQRFQAQAPNWESDDNAHRIVRTVRFRNFREAIAFVQEIGELAETEGHHPDISFGWGYVTISLSTKKIKGLQISSWRARSTECSIARARPSTANSDTANPLPVRPSGVGQD